MSSIFKRRSVRKFLKEEIPQEDIREILKAGMAAPSAKNNQDWVFIFIEDQADIERFIQVHPNGFAMRPAPVNILVCADKNKNKTPACDWGMLDAAAAMENLLIMPPNGLRSLWVGVAPDPKRVACIREICALPEHISPWDRVVGKTESQGIIDRYLEDAVSTEVRPKID
jgi:nitroreductase